MSARLAAVSPPSKSPAVARTLSAVERARESGPRMEVGIIVVVGVEVAAFAAASIGWFWIVMEFICSSFAFSTVQGFATSQNMFANPVPASGQQKGGTLRESRPSPPPVRQGNPSPAARRSWLLSVLSRRVRRRLSPGRPFCRATHSPSPCPRRCRWSSWR